MPAGVILNPYSNRWNAQKKWPEAESALKEAGVDFELFISEKKGGVVRLAEEAARKGCSPILAAGGDGTIGEVVNGMVKAAGGVEKPIGKLGILPLGSANDLVDNLGIPKKLIAAVQVIADGRTGLIDLCKCNDRYFANNSAAGLEPYVTTKNERIHFIKGILRYLIAALWAIMDRPAWQGKINWEHGEYEGPLTLVSIGNAPRTGGLFFMTPHADPRDGMLTFAFGYRRTRLGMLQALPRAMRPGKGSYVEMEGMQEIHCRQLSIHLNKPSPAHTDGELFPQWIQDFEYQIFPKRLELFLPNL